MQIFGLSGNIGSGKSTIASFFASLNYFIIDADQLSRLALNDKSIISQLVYNFGEQIICQNKSINRKKLAEIVFNRKSKLAILNDIVHPKIQELFQKKIIEISNQSISAKIIYDAALLFETGIYKKMKKNILVLIDPEKQLNRLTEKRGFNKKDALSRMQSQMNQEDKKMLADYIIDNNGDLNNTYRQVKFVDEQLQILS